MSYVRRSFVAANLARLRAEAGLSFDELSMVSGISANAIRFIEQKRRTPKPSTLRALATVFECSPQELASEPVSLSCEEPNV